MKTTKVKNTTYINTESPYKDYFVNKLGGLTITLEDGSTIVIYNS